ncbi:MAG: hypothetical protein GY898_16385 [Proteobacteria bacterium]|nr:hypothetical protein [Pseudomonadota bacterium]
MTELSPFLFAQHETDERVLQDAVDNLRIGLDQLDLDGTRLERSWIPDPLSPADVLDEGPVGSDPGDCVAVALVGRTDFHPSDHADFATSGDQRLAEPTATDYDRQVLVPDDPACFPGQVCGALVTLNDVRRENALYAARFELHKGYRWVGDDALIARSWLDRAYVGEGGNTELLQSYGVDVVLAMDDGEWVRFQVVYGEADLGITVDDDTTRAIMRSAVDGLIQRTDEAIADRR